MSLIIEIKVMPSSGRLSWVLDKTGRLKCFLKSPAEQGKANKELVKFTAKTLGIAQDRVTIMSGEISRNKRLKIDLDVTLDQLIGLLGIERQKSMFDE
ncbi:MAG: DUF167 domain-containing protein [Candidatus Dependentiae bacterium]|nr:DUF167 domain-containing protein [Candidatus Dependentiae bacterium]